MQLVKPNQTTAPRLAENDLVSTMSLEDSAVPSVQKGKKITIGVIGGEVTQ